MPDVKHILDNTILLIGEVAQSHEGSLGTAHAYIDAVADAGMHAVKFQTHYAAEESTPQEPWRVKFSTQDGTRYDYWKRMEFTPEQWKELAAHTHERGMLFIASPFSVRAVEVLEEAGVDCWKIASGELTNVVMLDAVAATGKPVFVSSGMSTVGEVGEVITRFTKQGIRTTLFQCTSNYPVAPERLGLNLLKEFSEQFRVPVGLSDHSGTIYAGLAAAALGAAAIEVHVTFHKKMFGPDVPSSITMDECRQLAEGTKFIHTALQHPVDKDALAGETAGMRKIFMKGIVAKEFIAKGTVLRKEHLAYKKPCAGIPAEQAYEVIGKTAANDIHKDAFIVPADIGGQG